MTVTFTNKPCKCGHPQVIHFMSTKECVTWKNIFEPDREVTFTSVPIKVERCKCNKYVPAS
jgi:hypothetical protein